MYNNDANSINTNSCNVPIIKEIRNTDTEHNSSSIYVLKINVPPNDIVHNDDMSKNCQTITKTSSDRNTTTEIHAPVES